MFETHETINRGHGGCASQTGKFMSQRMLAKNPCLSYAKALSFRPDYE